jgi:hypothetical protein
VLITTVSATQAPHSVTPSVICTGSSNVPFDSAITDGDGAAATASAIVPNGAAGVPTPPAPPSART